MTPGEKYEKLGNLLFQNTPTGTTIFLLNDEAHTYSKICLMPSERRRFLLALIDCEIECASIKIKDIEKRLSNHVPNEKEKKHYEERAKLLLIYMQNLDAVKKLLEGGDL